MGFQYLKYIFCSFNACQYGKSRYPYTHSKIVDLIDSYLLNKKLYLNKIIGWSLKKAKQPFKNCKSRCLSYAFYANFVFVLRRLQFLTFFVISEASPIFLTNSESSLFYSHVKYVMWFRIFHFLKKTWLS